MKHATNTKIYIVFDSKCLLIFIKYTFMTVNLN